MESPEKIYLITGLGNPGREYAATRHNIGFLTIDRLAAHLGVKFTRLEGKSLVTKGTYLDNRIILAKPQTYMNLSGQAVGSLVKYYKVPLEQVMIVYDEVDLPFGQIRIRPSGGTAGHKGMTSILERLATQCVPRMRLGIDRPPGRMDAAAYVLQEFSREEAAELPFYLERAIQAILTYVRDDLITAMNQFNSPPGE
jgi:PTH1 family peptidyl-tRNA hydrolase